MKLFEHKIRTDSRLALHQENDYDFYHRSASNLALGIRETLNRWFENYPAIGKSELLSRFKSSFSAAFFELFIHELFLQQGFNLEPHPIIQGTTKRPDFLVKGKGLEFYIEAKEATDKTVLEKSNDNKNKQLFDTINSFNSPNFSLGISEINLKSNRQPSGNRIIKFLEKELPQYDPAIVAEKLEKNPFDGITELIYEDQDIQLGIEIYPKSEEFRGNDGTNPIRRYPTKILWGGSENSIKSAIKRKANYYGELDKPYIICINSTSDKRTSYDDVLNALFGYVNDTFPYSFSEDSINPNQISNGSGDGLFSYSRRPRFTRVTATFISTVCPENLHVANHWFVNNPFAKFPIDMECFSLKKFVVENDFIRKVQGKSIREILQISENWIFSEE